MSAPSLRNRINLAILSSVVVFAVSLAAWGVMVKQQSEAFGHPVMPKLATVKPTSGPAPLTVTGTVGANGTLADITYMALTLDLVETTKIDFDNLPAATLVRDQYRNLGVTIRPAVGRFGPYIVGPGFPIRIARCGGNNTEAVSQPNFLAPYLESNTAWAGTGFGGVTFSFNELAYRPRLMLVGVGKSRVTVTYKGIRGQVLKTQTIGPIPGTSAGECTKFVARFADNEPVSSVTVVSDQPVDSGGDSIGIDDFEFILARDIAGPLWNFGDGSPEKKGGKVTHTYTKPGTYKVNLHFVGSSRIRRVDTVTVGASLPAVSGLKADTSCVSNEPVVNLKWSLPDVQIPEIPSVSSLTVLRREITYIIEDQVGQDSVDAGFRELKTLDKGARAFVDDTVTAGILYQYKIRSNAANGSKSDSKIVSIYAAANCAPVLTTVAITPPQLSLQTGKQGAFIASCLDQNGSRIAASQISWSSQDSFVRVLADGTVIAPNQPGNDIVTLTCKFNNVTKQAQAKVVVTSAITLSSAVFSPSGPLTIQPGETIQLTLNCLDQNGANIANATRSFVHSNGLGSVDANGIYTAPATIDDSVRDTVLGECKFNGVTKNNSIEINVEEDMTLASAKVEPSTSILVIGQSGKLTAQCLNQNGGVIEPSLLDGGQVKWASAKGLVRVLVDGTMVAGDQAGEEQITLTCALNGKEKIDTARVTVVELTQSADTDLAVKQPVYKPGERIIFTLTNNGPSAITLANAAPFEIKRNDSLVFAPITTQAIQTLEPGDSQEFFWEQKDNDGQQVANGTYVVSVSYSLGEKKITKDASVTIAETSGSAPPINNVPLPKPLIGFFKLNPVTGVMPLAVTFECTGDKLEDLVIDFDDGTVIKNVTCPTQLKHTYNEPGNYLVAVRRDNSLLASQPVNVQAVTLIKGTQSGNLAQTDTSLPIGSLAQTGASLLITLFIALIISGVISYFIIRRPTIMG